MGAILYAFSTTLSLYGLPLEPEYFISEFKKLEDVIESSHSSLEKARSFDQLANKFEALDRHSPQYLKAVKIWLKASQEWNAPCNGGKGAFHCTACSSKPICEKAMDE